MKCIDGNLNIAQGRYKRKGGGVNGGQVGDTSCESGAGAAMRANFAPA